jgi:hypothetical protein
MVFYGVLEIAILVVTPLDSPISTAWNGKITPVFRTLRKSHAKSRETIWEIRAEDGSQISSRHKKYWPIGITNYFAAITGAKLS